MVMSSVEHVVATNFTGRALSSEQLVFIARGDGPRRILAQKELARRVDSLLCLIARGQLASGYPFAVLKAAGLNGLEPAIRRYDPSRGDFIGYFGWWARHKIQRFIYEEGRLVVLPHNLHVLSLQQERLRKIGYAQDGKDPPQTVLMQGVLEAKIESFVKREERLPTEEEIREMRATLERQAVRLSMAEQTRILVDLDAPIKREDSEKGAIYERVAAPNPSPDDLMIGEQKREQIKAWVETLPTDLRRVIKLRYGIWPGQDSFTFRELATMMGLSYQTIKNYQARAEEILKTEIDDWGIASLPARTKIPTEMVETEQVLEEKFPWLLLEAMRYNKTVKDCFAVLADQEKTVLQLRFRGYSVGDVAAQLKLPPAEVDALETLAIIGIAAFVTAGQNLP